MSDPAIALSSVDLPLPDGPITAINRLRSNARGKGNVALEKRGRDTSATKHE